MIKIVIILILSAPLFSCSSIKKFDYRSAYKFKYLKYENLSKSDSLPEFLVSAELSHIHQGNLNFNHFKSQENEFIAKKNIMPVTNSRMGSVIKYSKPKTNICKDLTVFNKNSAQMEVKKNTGSKAIKHASGFRDLHPALQGFLFVVLGFGIVLAGALLGSIPVLSTILVIAGLVVAAIGFYLIATQI